MISTRAPPPHCNFHVASKSHAEAMCPSRGNPLHWHRRSQTKRPNLIIMKPMTWIVEALKNKRIDCDILRSISYS